MLNFMLDFTLDWQSNGSILGNESINKESKELNFWQLFFKYGRYA